MEDVLKKIMDYPDVTFIGGTSFAQLQEQMVKDYEKRYMELTGKETSLAAADPYRLILYSCAMAVYQGYQYEDKAGKMGLLKYSSGDFLDNLASLKGVARNKATPSLTTVRFTLSAPINKAAVIPKGTKLKGLELYFETTERGEIPPGKLSIELPAKCQTVGSSGNGYIAGGIRTLVDPLPYTLKAENTTPAFGGTDREPDESLAERIYLAPSSYSTAGPKAAYKFWVQTYNASIGECRILSEVPGEVDIYITVDGKPPTEDFIHGLEAFLENENIRPLTDHVVVKKPEPVSYDVECTYYIRNEDRDVKDTIKAAAEAAVEKYIAWQRRIGRDITPSRLIYEMIQAGVQSVDVARPVYMELQDSQMAEEGTVSITCGGLRDG